MCSSTCRFLWSIWIKKLDCPVSNTWTTKQATWHRHGLWTNEWQVWCFVFTVSQLKCFMKVTWIRSWVFPACLLCIVCFVSQIVIECLSWRQFHVPYTGCALSIMSSYYLEVWIWKWKLIFISVVVLSFLLLNRYFCCVSWKIKTFHTVLWIWVFSSLLNVRINHLSLMYMI